MWFGNFSRHTLEIKLKRTTFQANPNKVLGDRMKHRLMHKFVNFLDRYGVNMCVGCGRCVDADAGGMDLREILKKLSKEQKDRGKEESKVAK